MSTLYASFPNASDAEKAAGALLDHGARSEDLTLVCSDRGAGSTSCGLDASHAEKSAKTGISTTTAGDAAIGAVKGTVAGVGVGVLAALAAITLPGVGLVIGSGALALAMGAAAATAVAGAAVGGVAGFLRDQGVPEDKVTHYSAVVQEGGAVLALAVPSGDMTAVEAENTLAKYGATNVATYNAPRMLVDSIPEPPRPPLVVESANPDIEPLVIVDKVPSQTAVVEHQVVDPVSGERVVEVVQPAKVVTPPVGQVVIDTTTGTETVVPVDAVGVPTDAVPISQVTTIEPNRQAIVDPVSGTLHQTVGHTTKINETPAVVTDPVTGISRPATIVEEQRAVKSAPVVIAPDGTVVEDGTHQTVVTREEKVVLDDEQHRRG